MNHRFLNFRTASHLHQRTPDLQPSPGQMHMSGNGPTYTMGAVSENVTRQQKSACQSTGEISSQHVHQSVTQHSSDVQATGAV